MYISYVRILLLCFPITDRLEQSELASRRRRLGTAQVIATDCPLLSYLLFLVFPF